MRYDILENLVDFDTSRRPQSRIYHYGKHFGKDVSGTRTPDDYLALAQALARSASRGDAGTYVKERGNGDLAVYVDTPISRTHSHYQGIFLVVRRRGSTGFLATMFAPDDGKQTFDDDDRLLI